MSAVQCTVMKLLSLCICLQTLSGVPLGQQHGPDGVKVVVTEGSDALLPCSLSTKENIESKVFDWTKVAQKDEPRKEVFLYTAGTHYNNGRPGQSEEFKGRVFHFQDELRYGNASIIIKDTKVTHSGNYTCDFPRFQPRQIFYIELVIDPVLKDRSGEIKAASPKPYIWTLNATADWAQLQCEVWGAAPEPRLQWQDGAGHIIPSQEPLVSERGGSYNITLLTTVNKTDRYRCVVTQDDINHQTHAETFVHISERENLASKVATGWLGGLVLGAVLVLACQALLVHLKCIVMLRNKGRRLQENGPGNQENGPGNQENGPGNQRNGPRKQENGPRKQENGPRNEGHGLSQDPSEAVPLKTQDV